MIIIITDTVEALGAGVGRNVERSVYSSKVELSTAALCFFSWGTVSKPFLPLCPKPVYNSLSPP